MYNRETKEPSSVNEQDLSPESLAQSLLAQPLESQVELLKFCILLKNPDSDAAIQSFANEQPEKQLLMLQFLMGILTIPYKVLVQISEGNTIPNQDLDDRKRRLDSPTTDDRPAKRLRNDEPLQTKYSFFGCYKDNYKYFYEQIKEHDFILDETDTLGNVSTNDNLYFETGESIHEEHAKIFLNELWQNKPVIELLNYNLLLKMRNQVNKGYNPTIIVPGCISFVFYQINNNKYCLITHSLINKYLQEKLTDFITEVIDDFNNQLLPFEFVYHVKETPNFDALVQSVNSEANIPISHCSEKQYIRYLAKQFSEHQEQMKVLAALNFVFYPMKQDQKDNGDIEKFIRVKNIRNKVILDNDYVTFGINCCEVCRKNKKIMLKILKVAQNEELMNRNSALMSPLHPSHIHLADEEQETFHETNMTNL